MTELYFLDRALAVTAGPIDCFVSLVWQERYDTCGSYTLVLPAACVPLATVLGAAFLEVRGRKHLGRVEKVSFSGTDDGGSITVSGRMAESLLGDRIIPRRTAVSGPLCRAAEAVVWANAAELAGERRIEGLVVRAAETLTDDDGSVLMLDDHVSGKALDEWLYEVLGTHGASYRILPDFDAGTLVFEIYRGLDRTQAQEENTQALFSASFSSAGAFDLVSDGSEYRNIAYIAGEGEGDDRVEVTLDLRKSPDEPRRELYIDARDLRSDDGERVLTPDEYRALLETRGRQRLSSHSHILTVSGDAAAYTEEQTKSTSPDWGTSLAPIGKTYSSSMICGVHYALGDLCDIASEGMGMTWSERVTEVTYIYEGGCVRVVPKLGSAYPDLRTFLKQRLSEHRM